MSQICSHPSVSCQPIPESIVVDHNLGKMMRSPSSRESRSPESDDDDRINPTASDTKEEQAGLAAKSVSVSTDRSTFNYHSDTYKFPERFSYFIPNNVYNPDFAKAIQAACIFEAGERVYSKATKKDPDVKDLFLETYHCVLSELDDTYIGDDDKEQLKILTGGRQENSTVPMDGAKIAKKFSDFRRDLNRDFFTKLPKDVATLRSGRGLNEAYDELHRQLIDQFWKKDGKEPPENWVYKGPVPVFLFLCSQVFRKSPHLNPRTANIKHTSMKSRVEQKRDRQAKRKADADADARMDEGQRCQAVSDTNKTMKAQSKVLSANAYAQSVAVSKR